MTLSTINPFAKLNYGKGVYINEATIIEVEDVSGTTPLPFNKQKDIGIRLTLDVGRDFNPQMVIAGNFKRNDSGEIISWGSAFVVQELFAKLGFKGDLNPDNSIPEEALEALLGKIFLKLAYISGTRDNGKYFYSDWLNIGTIDEGAEKLAQRFRSSLAKGYPKNYRPELLDAVQAAETSAEAEVAVPAEDKAYHGLLFLDGRMPHDTFSFHSKNY